MGENAYLLAFLGALGWPYECIAHFGFNWFLNIHFTEVTLTGAKGTMLLIQNYSSSSLYQQFITGFYTFCVLFSVVQIKHCQLATLSGNKTCHLGEWSMRWEAAPGAARTPPIQSASPTQATSGLRLGSQTHATSY